MSALSNLIEEMRKAGEEGQAYSAEADALHKAYIEANEKSSECHRRYRKLREILDRHIHTGEDIVMLKLASGGDE